jgi:hypothetical protein
MTVAAKENVRTQIRLLLEDGHLPRSVCSQAMLDTIKPLLDTRVVVEERFGGGRRLAVRDAAALSEFWTRRFPNAPLFDGAPDRVASVARFRDSKASAGDTPSVITLRAWSDIVLWKDGNPVRAARATAVHGIFAFLLSPENCYELLAPCALVENPAVLLAFERMRPAIEIAAVLYGGGRISRRVLNWLARQSAPGFRLVHFPDYDPVGLNEFVRLRAALGERVRLHIPEDLAELFSRFGNVDLLRREASQALLPKLRTSELMEVRAVLELIERHNAGLEQEALLIERPPAAEALLPLFPSEGRRGLGRGGPSES